jgi:hypothetical protein
MIEKEYNLPLTAKQLKIFKEDLESILEEDFIKWFHNDEWEATKDALNKINKLELEEGINCD